MRDFFKHELKTLKAKTGLNQYETFSGMPDAEVQLKTLLDGMVSVCSGFNYIPDDHKKEIIKAAIITDPEFTGLNARVIFKWLQAKNHLYFKEVAHVQTETLDPETKAPVEPLKGDDMQRMLDRWKRELDGVSNNFSVPKLTPEEIQKEGQEKPGALQEELDRLSKSRNGYKMPDAEKIALQNACRAIASNLYKDRKDFRGLYNFEVEGIEIFCESQSKAEEIYIEALTLNE